MDMPFFDFLEGLSPWWWVAFGISLGALEMATMSFFLIWPGLAAIIMAIILVAMPTMPGEVQVAVFASLSVLLTFLGRWVMSRYGDGGGAPGHLNNRTGQMVGRRGTLLSVRAGEATVEIDGVHWRATLGTGEPVSPGAAIEVVAAHGTTLEVRGLGAI